MRNPTKKQMAYVISKLKTILPQAKFNKQFNMSECVVLQTESPAHQCGTIHCIMGWYAVANKNRKIIKKEINTGYCGYVAGCYLMSKDLGFSETGDFNIWAESNPKKWGNDDGNFLDSDPAAYDGAKNMREVVEFLERVEERL